jgi:hypothetical protein
MDDDVDDDDQPCQTARWSGGGPSRGRGRAPQAQGRTSPDHNPPTTEHYAQVMARINTEYPPNADAYAWVIERDDDSQPRQTTRWSGGSPGHGRGHASRAQELRPPERKPPPVNDYIQELEKMEAEGYGPQTARWRGGGPRHRCGVAPRMDTTGRTLPHETARRGGGRFRRYDLP